MIGAIAGDIIGSVYEWHNLRSKEFPLFVEQSRFTDDSVMTIAVAEAILKGGDEKDFIKAMQKYGRHYPRAGYGGHFVQWLQESNPKPYGSFGNGSAMRVSPCGWARDLEVIQKTGTMPDLDLTDASAIVSHNHPEGIKGARAISDAIVLARIYKNQMTDPKTGELYFKDIDALKAGLKRYIESAYGYDLSRTLDEIRPYHRFDVSCQGSVPEAIIAFLESTDFEDAIRNAISIGGDSDTIAAMAGSITEAAYGVPDWIRKEAESRLTKEQRKVVAAFEKRYGC